MAERISRRAPLIARVAAFIALIALTVVVASLPAGAESTRTKRPHPKADGALRVEGTQLVDSTGEPVVLRGVSTHGLTWFPTFVNDAVFYRLATDWGANVVRLALYSEDYCGSASSPGNKTENLSILYRGIDAAIATDLYVIVDWHVLRDEDPNVHKQDAIEFFKTVSEKYSGNPRVIYEICNEPNGNVVWSDIRSYAEEVIPVIRANSPEAVIIVGTPNFDRMLMGAASDPLEFDNVMYACHFYAASHGEDLREEIRTAMSRGLPIFLSEVGLSEESGDGDVDYEAAVEWFEFADELKLSYTVWSLSNKLESSAMIRATAEHPALLEVADLTEYGNWVRSLIQGNEPSTIPVPPKPSLTISYIVEFLVSTLGEHGLNPVRRYALFTSISIAIMAIGAIAFFVARRSSEKRNGSYDDLLDLEKGSRNAAESNAKFFGVRAAIALSAFFTLVYLCWRMTYSLPITFGWIAVAANVVLLVVETLGLIESLIHYASMVRMREHPLPKIADDEFPHVDIFVATYNEPEDLLRRTINGCTHLRYPDKSKVHVWICDDARRPSMRALAEEMGVGYFDRPDNEGAKAGNLNCALARTEAPYVVTLDADMIPRSDFLLKTIPYFVDAEKRNAALPEDKRLPLGLLQTPQCFYQPDVFQHALYSETSSPNEQDFFYRTIEVAKTSENAVIYGGSNTVIARAALEKIGGFYTESITEDFATGILIESAGFVSLATPEPLASGMTPNTFAEHIKQRMRWGRGVIVTARKLHLMSRPGLSLMQRLSYWSSVVYWYSPIKSVIYLLSPLMFAVFGIPVFRCTWLDLALFWLPMYIMQTIALRVVSGNAASSKWSGIYETSVMAHLLIPIVKELFGITLSTFAVTDKGGASGKRVTDWRRMAPYLVLAVLSVVGIARVIWLCTILAAPGLFVLLFWLIRNLYYILMAIFLIDGRDMDEEAVKVIDAEFVTVARTVGEPLASDGVTTFLNEHSLKVFLDEGEGLRVGDHVSVAIDTALYHAEVTGVVTDVVRSARGMGVIHEIEILDMCDSYYEYLQILYDRIPTLPQSLGRDYGFVFHLWRNIANRLARTAG